MNLVANAVRHAGTPGRVTIVGTSEDGAVRLEVTDSGPGIDPELLPRLFERFAKDPASPGFGLGLAIARGLAEAHGGSIGAASEPGRGTTMTVKLPTGAELLGSS
jgi:signal transduction histidine kinase